MRIRAVVAAGFGTLALSALALPAAHADQAAPSAKPTPTVSSLVVNGGKNIVVGVPKEVQEVPVTLVASARSGISNAEAILWQGDDLGQAGSTPGHSLFPLLGNCTQVSATTSACAPTIEIGPDNELRNTSAGEWNVAVVAEDNALNRLDDTHFSTVKLLRDTRLSIEIPQAQAKQGETIPVNGAFTEANWDTKRFEGIAAATARLQFREEGTQTWTTVATVRTDEQGVPTRLSTPVTASKDGFFRWQHPADGTSAASASPQKFVNVIG